MKQIKNYIAIISIIALMFTHVTPALVWAEGESDQPATTESTASAPSAPENTNVAPTAPTAPSTPGQENASSPTPAPEQGQSNQNNNNGGSNENKSPEQSKRDADRAAAVKAAEDAYWANANAPKSGTVSNGNVGNTVIGTGNANNNSASVTNANNNGVATGQPSGAVSGNGSGGAVINSGNGVGSDNTSNSSGIVNNNTNQNNGAVVSNDANQSSISGDNQSSGNVGDTVIKSGDSNTSATAISALNTNVDGVMVSEFNVVDDQKGDIILSPEAFAANCISGCTAGTGSVKNTGNGANSDNNASTNATVNNNTTQNNDATVGNTMNLSANSGTNDASFNTGGDNVIYTGDANVSANALTFANNNIAGNVTYGVVNIYGNLEGDIILPEFSGGSVGSNGTTGTNVANSGNGVNSNNNASANTAVNNNTAQNNDANITNDLVINAQTGNNDAGYSTDGNNTVLSGDTNVDANVVNIANTNINGGTWWLVFINQAGNWIGKLVGSPDGSQMAGSEGTEFSMGADGQINVSNGGNGAGSTNNANTTSTVNNTTEQNNTADIHNTLNLSANTGGNTANYNTGGNNSIVTGDANVIANIVNFVNNNIVGNGKLAVTFINVFGSWAGDFIAPGQHKQDKPSNANDSKAITDSRGGTSTSKTTNTTVNQTVNTVEEKTPAKEVVTTETSYTKVRKANNLAVVGNNGAADNTQVAGISTTNGGSKNPIIKQLFGAENKKVINLNLAYLILLFPLIALGIVTKKLVFGKLLAKKN